MIRYIALGLSVMMLSCSTEQSAVESSKGWLLICGGGHKPGTALQAFVERCHGKPVVVISSASAVPFQSGPATADLFRRAGADSVRSLFIAGPDTANTDSVVTLLSGAGGIFFTGGVQSRLMNRIRGTRAEQIIRSLYFDKKGIVGGTSAGAAVQSKLMITGEGDFSQVVGDNVETRPGLGLLNDIIIDQHFTTRQRQNRLISLVIEHRTIGIGIDEDTAILMHPDRTLDVFGSGPVMIYDPRPAVVATSDSNQVLSMHPLRLSILKAGQSFDIGKSEMIHSQNRTSL